MTQKLTSSYAGISDTDLSWLDGVFTEVTETLYKDISHLGATPLAWQAADAAQRRTLRLGRDLNSRAHAEDFLALEALGRVRLSKETRKAEVKRLKRKYVKRKKYTFRYGRKHNKLKEKTRKEYNNRQWEKDPLTRLRYTSRKPVHISREEWDRCIAPVWGKYDRKYLKLKGGSKTEGYTIHNLMIWYHPPKGRGGTEKSPELVYDGYSQAVHDSMVI